MPDVRELMTQGARAPREGLDLDQVAFRARSIGQRRRLAASLAAAAAVLAIVVPGARLLSSPRADRLRPADPLTESPGPTPSARQSTALSTAPSLSMSPLATPSVPSSLVPVASASPRPTRSPAASRGAAAPAYPPARGCWIDTEDMLPGEERSCSFTATATGGWRYRSSGGVGFGRGSGYWVVYITRDGVTDQNPGDTGADCANDEIRPGDRVQLVLRTGEDGVSFAHLGAGADYRCGTR